MAATVVTIAAAAFLVFVAHLVDLFHGFLFHVSSVLAAAVFTGAAAAGLVVVAFFVELLDGASFTTGTRAAAAALLVVVTIILLGFGCGEAGVIGTVLEAAIVTVFTVTSVLEVSAHGRATATATSCGFALGLGVSLLTLRFVVLSGAFFTFVAPAAVVVSANLL